jgi:hypothetical protein
MALGDGPAELVNVVGRLAPAELVSKLGHRDLHHRDMAGLTPVTPLP